MGAAGPPAQAGGARLKGTLGQPTPIGVGTGTGHTLYAGFWHVWRRTVTGIEGEPPVFADRLFQNYPNPFNPTTSIRYTIAETGRVDITIYNVKGERVLRLFNETMPPGPHEVTWNGTNERGHPVASGVYFYRLQVGGFSDVKKMVILK